MRPALGAGVVRRPMCHTPMENALRTRTSWRLGVQLAAPAARFEPRHVAGQHTARA